MSMSDWPTYKISDVCDFKNGFAFKSGDYVPCSNDTIEVFRMGYIERGGGFKEDSTPVFVPRSYKKNISDYFLEPGDILIAMTDMKNNVAILANTARVKTSNRFVLNQRVGRIRVSKTKILDPTFLYFYTNWKPHVEYLRSRANSGVQVNLSTSAIKDAEISLPPIEEQKAIAAVLGALDDKIENNRAMNVTLEEMARAIFKSWFVDFDPVHAKSRGEQPAHMDAETAALFPDRFGDDGLPEGWLKCGLDEISDFLNGLALQKFPPTGEDDLPVIKIAELRNGITEKTGKAARSIDPKYIIKDGDVIFSWSGSLMEKIWSEGEGALNQHLFKVSSEKYPKWFYRGWINIHMRWFQEIAASKATTMGHIQRKHLNEAQVIYPPQKAIKGFHEILSPLLDMQLSNDLENNTLAELRDTLLPKLMSGEIRIKDAEREVGAAV